jgi:hypothetical protein
MLNRYYLFRVKVYPASQADLFLDTQNRRTLLKGAVEAKPSFGTGKRSVWQIGNVQVLTNDDLYFRIGKIASLVDGRFDEQEKNFSESENVHAPSTSVFLNLKYQVCAIATNTKLAAQCRFIGNRLASLLGEANKGRGVEFELTEIPDPENFIEAIRDAYSVTRFSVEFSLPNPWDVSKDFHEPMERYLNETKGRRGKTEIESDIDLDRTVLEKITRSIASTGNRVFAMLKPTKESKTIRKQLSGNPVSVESDDGLQEEGKRAVAEQVIAAYLAVRQPADANE